MDHVLIEAKRLGTELVCPMFDGALFAIPSQDVAIDAHFDCGRNFRRDRSFVVDATCCLVSILCLYASCCNSAQCHCFCHRTTNDKADGQNRIYDESCGCRSHLSLDAMDIALIEEIVFEYKS
jgi:hypothetical protein